MQEWLEGKKTYIVLSLGMLLHFLKANGVDVMGFSAESLYTQLEPVIYLLAASFKMAADHRHDLTKKDLTIVRLAATQK